MFLYFDSLVVLLLAVLSVLASNRDHLTANTIQDFLALRVTVLNAVFLTMFAVFRATLGPQTFSDRRLRGIGSELGSTARRAALMTVLLALYLVGRQAAEPIASVTTAFF